MITLWSPGSGESNLGGAGSWSTGQDDGEIKKGGLGLVSNNKSLIY